MILEAATLCLALNVFHEARGEFIPGQYAVALVTMNRAGGDPRRVCSEVFRPKQFSWTSSVAATKEGWHIPRKFTRATEQEPEAWALAWRIAQWTLAGRMPDLTSGSKFYHANYVRPVWRHKLTLTKTLGAHHFYRSSV